MIRRDTSTTIAKMTMVPIKALPCTNQEGGFNTRLPVCRHSASVRQIAPAPLAGLQNPCKEVCFAKSIRHLIVSVVSKLLMVEFQQVELPCSRHSPGPTLLPVDQIGFSCGIPRS